MRGEGKFEVGIYGGDKATYFGMAIGEVSDSDFDGLISDPGNYEGRINQIEIPRERANQRNEALTEAYRSTSRSELRN